jgi:hypothetical protein
MPAGVPSFGGVDSIPPTKHKKCMGGYDGGCETGFCGVWEKSAFGRLLDKLDGVKQNGQETLIELCGREFYVKPCGIGGGAADYFRYVIESGGVTVMIHHSPDTCNQQVRVHFGFLSLVGRSLFDVHKETTDFLFDLGFAVDFESEKISRIDGFVMTARPVSDYVLPVRKMCVVKRARIGAIYEDTGKKTSFNFGTDIIIRCYDKRHELMYRADEIKLKSVMEYNCGGVLPDNLTRVEFELHRDVLNELDIDTIEDLKECEHSLFQWLTYDWFRILNEPVKKGHSREQMISPLWAEIRSLFSLYFPGGGKQRIITRLSNRLKDVRCDGDDLFRQAVGCLAAVAARVKGVALSGDNLIKYLFERIETFRKELLRKTAQRRIQYSVKHGLDLGLLDDAFALLSVQGCSAVIPEEGYEDFLEYS